MERKTNKNDSIFFTDIPTPPTLDVFDIFPRRKEIEECPEKIKKWP